MNKARRWKPAVDEVTKRSVTEKYEVFEAQTFTVSISIQWRGIVIGTSTYYLFTLSNYTYTVNHNGDVPITLTSRNMYVRHGGQFNS